MRSMRRCACLFFHVFICCSLISFISLLFSFLSINCFPSLYVFWKEYEDYKRIKTTFLIFAFLLSLLSFFLFFFYQFSHVCFYSLLKLLSAFTILFSFLQVFFLSCISSPISFVCFLFFHLPQCYVSIVFVFLSKGSSFFSPVLFISAYSLFSIISLYDTILSSFISLYPEVQQHSLIPFHFSF